MTEETKKLFDAPWSAYPLDDVGDANGNFVCSCETPEIANRIALLPELYDALKHATHTLCVSFCASCLPKGSETGMATFIQNGCPRGSESCDMAKWWEIIRKMKADA